MQGGGDETGNDQPHSFFNPDAYENQDTGDIEGAHVLVHFGRINRIAATTTEMVDTQIQGCKAFSPWWPK